MVGRGRSRVLIVGALAALAVAGIAVPGSSQGTEVPGTTVAAVSGRAYGAQVQLLEETETPLDPDALADAVLAGDAGAVTAILTEAGVDLDGGDVTAAALVEASAGPAPEVVLPAEGGGPVTDSLATLDLQALNFVFPVASLLEVSTQGSLGPSGSVTSSASAADVFPEADFFVPFTAGLIETECSASLEGVSASTTIVDGIETIADDVPIVGAPDPNTVLIDEVIEINLGAATLRVTVFLIVNEQTSDATSISVTGARTFATTEILIADEDPLVLSDLEATISHSECGVVAGAVAPPSFTG